MSPSDLTDEDIDRDPPSAADRWLEGMPRNHDKISRVMPPSETAGWGTCVSWKGNIVARVPGRKRDEIARAAAMIAAAPRLIQALREKVIALRAILEGRTTPPTDAEIDAHHAAGGSWLTGDTVTWAPVSLRGMRDNGETEGCVWIALDRSYRPCAWPRPGGVT